MMSRSGKLTSGPATGELRQMAARVMVDCPQTVENMMGFAGRATLGMNAAHQR
jgi:hypothetical protein